MKQLVLILSLFIVAVFSTPSEAQLPHIVGTWKLNPEASDLPEPRPQSQIRQYSLQDDGYLVGLVVTIDAQGNPGFLQIAAKSDGQDYPEYSAGDLAELQMNGTPTPLAYAERVVDDYTVAWFDKYRGEVYAAGTRQVAPDGRTMTITIDAGNDDAGNDDAGNEEGAVSTFKLVFDRQ